ncbi:MAG: ribonuclease HII [Nitrososphaerales archaeon]
MDSLLLAGVDDAGRGSVLGPLVIAGVSIEESKVHKLVELGVKDSKLLSPKRRSILYKEIKKVASIVAYERIEPGAIDSVVLNGEKLYRLNYLEAKFMARVLLKLKFDLAYVDCCDTNQSRFGDLIADLLVEQRVYSTRKKRSAFKLGERNPIREKIRSEHHADRNYPVVSAASIIAKVTRDRAITRLHRKHGTFGSGYPADPETLAFLKKFIANSKTLPSFTRLSWATVTRLYGRPSLPKIDDDY